MNPGLWLQSDQFVSESVLVSAVIIIKDETMHSHLRQTSRGCRRRSQCELVFHISILTETGIMLKAAEH